ncbi:MAG: hypothetical protein K2N73_17340 [Lachnospiraceae bacterium]|nr:hypothetical protein [Lachnospiraceae bacterium]
MNAVGRDDALKQKKIIFIGKVMLSLLAFSLNYAIVDGETADRNFEQIYSFIPRLSAFFHSIDAQPLRTLALLFILIRLYQITDCDRTAGRKKYAMAVWAAIASVSLLAGNAICKYGELEIMFTGTVQIVKGSIIFCGYYLFFYKLCSLMVYGYERYMGHKTYCLESKFFHAKYAGVYIFGMLLIAWGLALLVYYPAIFMGDTEDILYMAFNYPTKLAETVKLPREGIYLTNHHPIIYTVIIGYVIKASKSLGLSDNGSVFVCAAIQCIVNAAVLSYSCIYCARQLKKYRMAIAALVFWVVCPWISKYAIMLSKDTLFACFVLLFGIRLHQILNQPEKQNTLLGILLSAAMVLLFRKNGFYIILSTFLIVLLLYRKHWKRWLSCIAVVVVLNAAYADIMLPALGIADGSVREALSVPFQQTARFIQRHGDEVTEQERDAIDAVLQYDVLAKVYSSEIADPVKGRFRKDARKEDLIRYFKTWFCMFWRHPGTYAAATLNNYYGYFYPVVNDVQKLYNTSVGSMSNANRDGYFQYSNCYDAAHVWLRDICSLYDMAWMKLPIINSFMTSAFYVWVVLSGCLFKYIRGDKQGFVFMSVYIATILTALAGPCNAIDYERYIYPLIAGLPVITGITLHESREQKDKGKEGLV